MRADSASASSSDTTFRSIGVPQQRAVDRSDITVLFGTDGGNLDHGPNAELERVTKRYLQPARRGTSAPGPRPSRRASPRAVSDAVAVELAGEAVGEVGTDLFVERPPALRAAVVADADGQYAGPHGDRAHLLEAAHVLLLPPLDTLPHVNESACGCCVPPETKARFFWYLRTVASRECRHEVSAKDPVRSDTPEFLSRDHTRKPRVEPLGTQGFPARRAGVWAVRIKPARDELNEPTGSACGLEPTQSAYADVHRREGVVGAALLAAGL